jgi:Flp pilus assembly pilin Flp
MVNGLDNNVRRNGQIKLSKLWKKLQAHKGQALTEYTIIFPAAVLVVVGVAWALGTNISDVYRHVASVIVGQNACVAQYDHEDNSICDGNEYCEMVEYEDIDSGSYIYEDALSIDAVVIKAGKTYEVRRDDPFKFVYITDDGCYRVTFKTNKIEWERTGGGQDCQGVSHIDHWQAPICTSE